MLILTFKQFHATLELSLSIKNWVILKNYFNLPFFTENTIVERSVHLKYFFRTFSKVTIMLYGYTSDELKVNTESQTKTHWPIFKWCSNFDECQFLV